MNRAVLPHLRRNHSGLLVRVSSSSGAGGTPPYLAPDFGAKVAVDAITVQYARELVRWGIETSIIVPDAFTSGTNHFAHAEHPGDTVHASEYDTNSPYTGFGAQVQRAFADIVPFDADASLAADAINGVVNAPFCKRPFRVHVDPTQDGADVSVAVPDRVRAEMLQRVGLSDLLPPHVA